VRGVSEQEKEESNEKSEDRKQETEPAKVLLFITHLGHNVLDGAGASEHLAEHSIRKTLFDGAGPVIVLLDVFLDYQEGKKNGWRTGDIVKVFGTAIVGGLSVATAECPPVSIGLSTFGPIIVDAIGDHLNNHPEIIIGAGQQIMNNPYHIYIR